MVQIMRVFRYRNEPNRIHFVIEEADGGERHLYVDRGNPLFDVLYAHVAVDEEGEPVGQV